MDNESNISVTISEPLYFEVPCGNGLPSFPIHPKQRATCHTASNEPHSDQICGHPLFYGLHMGSPLSDVIITLQKKSFEQPPRKDPYSGSENNRFPVQIKEKSNLFFNRR